MKRGAMILLGLICGRALARYVLGINLEFAESVITGVLSVGVGIIYVLYARKR